MVSVTYPIAISRLPGYRISWDEKPAPGSRHSRCRSAAQRKHPERFQPSVWKLSLLSHGETRGNRAVTPGPRCAVVPALGEPRSTCCIHLLPPHQGQALPSPRVTPDTAVHTGRAEQSPEVRLDSKSTAFLSSYLHLTFCFLLKVTTAFSFIYSFCVQLISFLKSSNGFLSVWGQRQEAMLSFKRS